MGNKSTPPGDQADERIIVQLIAGPLDGSHVAAKSKARRLRIAHPGGKAIYVREDGALGSPKPTPFMKTTQADKVTPKRKRGRPPEVPPQAFVNVCQAFAQGLPLEMALAAEAIPKSTWYSALKANEVYRTQYGAAKAIFLAQALTRLTEHQDPKHLEWVLERRHPDLFRRPAETEVNTNVTVNQLPADLVQRARDLAKQRMAKPKA
jgi:hypothetical protein